MIPLLVIEKKNMDKLNPILSLLAEKINLSFDSLGAKIHSRL